jgi:EipB-like
VTVLESGETGARTSDLRTTTFEAGDGKSLRFKTESQMDGAVKSAIDGAAERSSSRLAIRLSRPKPETVTVAGAPVFPSEHMKRLITAARNGERTLGVSVFDGSDDGKKVYDTLAVIGRRIEPGSADGLEAAARQESLSRVARWPVTLSYFSPGEGERTPIYVLSFEMYENGVSRALRLDYGDLALKGDMQSIEFLPVSACQR